MRRPQTFERSPTLLPNGKVLVVGGYSDPDSTASAELYDPKSNSWSAVASSVASRYAHTATLLPGGKVLVAGGFGRDDARNSVEAYKYLLGVELYDPSTNMWETGGTLVHGRLEHTATLLPNGKLLLLGGFSFEVKLGSFPELFDPGKGIGIQLPAPFDFAYSGSATMLKNGKVLYVNGDRHKSLAALYNPDTELAPKKRTA